MAIIKLENEAEREAGIYYEVDLDRDPIGVGGMGKVYEGKLVNDTTGGSRPVAIKFMYEDLQPQAIEKARREASIRLHNDNLLEMLGFLETEDKDTFGNTRKHYHVISELLEGITLQEIIEGNVPDPEDDGGFGMQIYNEYRTHRTQFALRVIKAILSGVMAMHDAGYIHRDIDPSNIMLTKDGCIKLIDFGIAKKIDNLNTNDRSFTIDGKFIGKPKYAAPEQVLGDIAHQNQTTDIYAIGILLFQLLCGHLPFEGPAHEIMQMQIKNKLPLTEINDSSLRKIVKRATEKKQDSRFQSASEFRAALDKSEDSETDKIFDAMSNSLKRTFQNLKVPRQAIVIAISVLGLILGCVLALYV